MPPVGATQAQLTKRGHSAVHSPDPSAALAGTERLGCSQDGRRVRRPSPAVHPLIEQTEEHVFGFIIFLLVIGLVAGFAARALVPGRDPMGVGGTIVRGVVGSFVGASSPGRCSAKTSTRARCSRRALSVRSSAR